MVLLCFVLRRMTEGGQDRESSSSSGSSGSSSSSRRHIGHKLQNPFFAQAEGPFQPQLTKEGACKERVSASDVVSYEDALQT